MSRAFIAITSVLAFAIAAAAWQDAGRAVGTVKAVSGQSLTLTTDAGAEITVQVQAGTRIVQAAPGQRDLAGAPAIPLAQIQAGDRVLVRGAASADAKSIAATSVVVMKKEAISQKQQREVEDWQKRGVGGLVSAVDTAAGNITLATSALGTAKNVTVHVGKDAVLRRYAPDSIKFDDAVRGTLADVKPGDQLRARGERNAEGTELTAEEIVSGSFRNLSGVITSVDAAKNTITFTDLATKKPVTVRITAESQMRKLAPQMAGLIAARLRGPQGDQPQGPPPQGAAPAGAAQGPRPGPGGGGRGGDMQQLLARAPAVTFAELVKGDAVMMVTTPGSATSDMTVVTLLDGVEAILTAPGRQVATLLSPWNLGGGEGGE